MSRRLFATKCGSISLLWNHVLQLKMFVSDQTCSQLSVKRRSAVMVVIYIYDYYYYHYFFFFCFEAPRILRSFDQVVCSRCDKALISDFDLMRWESLTTPQPDARRVSVDAATLCDVRWKQISHCKRKVSHAFFWKLMCCVFTLN